MGRATKARRHEEKKFSCLPVFVLEFMLTGRIHSFESCGTVDGPGIRFVVFMQGCPLRCLYCHNRDTWDFKGGTEYTIPAVMKEIRKYKSYMRFSGGGVTVTGGEPLYQPDFIQALLKQCQKEGIHTTVDTSGYVKVETVKQVFESTDLILLDLKCLDDGLHKRLVGVELSRILEFAQYVAELGKPIWIRHVLVPGWTDRDDLLQKLGEFVSTLKTVEVVEILPYHQMGEYKWEELGREYQLKDVKPPTKKHIKHAIEILKKFNLNVR
jgi:pyruvate formate lyase activating enzyme